MTLNLNYYKPEKDLFNSLKINNIINVQNIQNYIPLYHLLFKINNTNFNSINIENNHYISKFNSKHNDNIYNITLNNNTNTDIFIKYSPLLDPSKYLIGKYGEIVQVDLPKLIYNKHDLVEKKINNPYNSSYVDGFFSYLSNYLSNHSNFKNGIKFYGAYLANKKDFRYNLEDDIMYIHNSQFFNKHINKLFTLDEEYKDLFSGQSRSNNSKLNIIDDEVNLLNIEKLDSDNKNDNDKNNQVSSIKLLETLEKKEKSNKTNSFNSSNCSSNISLTSSENDNLSELGEISDDNKEVNLQVEKLSSKTNPLLTSDNLSLHNKDITVLESSTNSISMSSKDSIASSDNSENSDNSDNSLKTSSENSEMDIFINIPNFPTNIICLEKCESTLDDYIIKQEINNQEWKAILLQVIFTLLTYQKVFKFTHNDLHTNNIMYVHTEKQFLYYHYNNSYFKVPTFGKIWKIIDFGRAIYTVNDNVIYSDSFELGEDAYSQYNFDKFRNKKKKEILPNYSFDLCRLGCSLYEYFFCENPDKDKLDKLDEIELLVKDWCLDDEGRNILFKSNGEERYPDFKLYKMIARTVTKHTPENELKKELFKEFIVSKNKINNKKAIFSIQRICNELTNL